MFSNTQFPFLATFELPNLSKLINDPIQHKPSWLVVLIKIHRDIPKFDGKTMEDLTNQNATCHLWCVSNLLLDDRIHLHLLPHTLTNNASKWFIKLLTTSFNLFNDLVIAFLAHFQLPILYEMSIKIPTSL